MISAFIIFFYTVVMIIISIVRPALILLFCITINSSLFDFKFLEEYSLYYYSTIPLTISIGCVCEITNTENDWYIICSVSVIVYSWLVKTFCAIAKKLVNLLNP